MQKNNPISQVCTDCEEGKQIRLHRTPGFSAPLIWVEAETLSDSCNHSKHAQLDNIWEKPTLDIC